MEMPGERVTLLLLLQYSKQISIKIKYHLVCVAYRKFHCVKSDRNSSDAIVKIEGIRNTTVIITFKDTFSYRIC